MGFIPQLRLRHWCFHLESLRTLWNAIIHNRHGLGHIGLLKRLAPLRFDPGLDIEHIQALLSDEKKINPIGELEALYDDIDDREDHKRRLQILDLVGQDGVYIDSDEEDDEDVSG